MQHLGKVDAFPCGKACGGVALLCSPQLLCSLFQLSGLQEVQWEGGAAVPARYQVSMHIWQCSLCPFIILMPQEPKKKGISIFSLPPRMTQDVFFSVFFCFSSCLDSNKRANSIFKRLVELRLCI